MSARPPFATAFAFSTLLALAACGGGGGGDPASATPATPGSPGGGSAGGGSSSGGSSSGGSSGGSGASAIVYETAVNPATRVDMLTQLNSEGARGFAFISPIAFTGDAGTIHTLYAKSASATYYAYEIQDTPSTAAGVLAQANAEGARGFRRATELTVGTVYIHVVGSTTTYSYESLPAATTSSGFIVQADTEGGRGFLYTVVDGAGGTFSALYVKSSASTAVYAYDTQPFVTAADAFVTQANAEGAQGYRFHTSYVFNDATVNLYVRDMTAASTFSYLTQPAVTHVTDYVTQANTEGATGTVLIGEFTGGPTPNPYDLYFTPHSCTGALCSPVGSLGS